MLGRTETRTRKRMYCQSIPMTNSLRHLPRRSSKHCYLQFDKIDRCSLPMVSFSVTHFAYCYVYPSLVTSCSDPPVIFIMYVLYLLFSTFISYLPRLSVCIHFRHLSLVVFHLCTFLFATLIFAILYIETQCRNHNSGIVTYTIEEHA